MKDYDKMLDPPDNDLQDCSMHGYMQGCEYEHCYDDYLERCEALHELARIEA